MKLVHSSTAVPELAVLRSMLEREGIRCEVRSATPLDVLVGEPATGQLWVERDEDYSCARSLCDAWEHPDGHPGEAWICGQCQTKLAGVFDTCWKCGTPRSAPV